MPRIDHADNLKLGAIVDQLALNDADDTRELRSSARGRELYVKEKRAFFTSLFSRKLHRHNAIALVRNGLATEFGIRPEQARKILDNVFGHAPRKITVGDVLRLRDLGRSAARVHERFGYDFIRAFELAQGMKNFPERAHFQQMAEQMADTENTQLEAVVSDPIPGKTHDIATGTETPGQIVAKKAHKKFPTPDFAAVREQMSTLPPYQSSTPEQKKVWLDLALKQSVSLPIKQLQRLPIGQKLSLQEALAHQFRTLQKQGDPTDTEALSAIVRANFTLNRAYTMHELVSLEETRMQEAFLSGVGNRAIVRRARTDWGSMDTAQRKKVIQTIVDLHADIFGYATSKPSLVFEHCSSDKKNFAGYFNYGENKITLVTDHKFFDEFGSTVNTVIHELTHKYQNEFVARKRVPQFFSRLVRREIAPDNLRYTRARLFDMHSVFYSDMRYLIETLHFPEDLAHDCYVANLIERHAFYMGNYAEAQLRKISASQNPTGEQP